MDHHRDSAAWHKSVDERIRLITDTLNQDSSLDTKLPGLKPLLDDYLDGTFDSPLRRQDFHRGLLQVFRDSAVDNTYQDQLAEFSSEERDRVASFVDGKPLDECCLGFKFGASLGVREHLSRMMEAEAVQVSSAGPVHVKGLSMGKLMERDGIFHKFVHKLAEIFGDDDEKHSVLVRIWNDLWY